MAGDAQHAEDDLGFARARNDALRIAEFETGVDTDQEMQQLLLVEKAFSANARVMQTIEDLLDTLLRIGT